MAQDTIRTVPQIMAVRFLPKSPAMRMTIPAKPARIIMIVAAAPAVAQMVYERSLANNAATVKEAWRTTKAPVKNTGVPIFMSPLFQQINDFLQAPTMVQSRFHRRHYAQALENLAKF